MLKDPHSVIVFLLYQIQAINKEELHKVNSPVVLLTFPLSAAISYVEEKSKIVLRNANK